MTEVVAALIWEADQFMICQRPAHKARGLKWEFVGGKVEPGETKEQALIRECREELAVTVSVGEVFMDVVHEYPDLTVHLTLFHASIAEGVPEAWIMERFDRTEKLLERVLKKNNTLDGEEVLDNQDLCLLLKVGIRTLQRYRAIGVLPYFTISGKVFYRTKDVHEFIRTRFADVEERAAKRKEKEARKEERRRKRGLFP